MMCSENENWRRKGSSHHLGTLVYVTLKLAVLRVDSSNTIEGTPIRKTCTLRAVKANIDSRISDGLGYHSFAVSLTLPAFSLHCKMLQACSLATSANTRKFMECRFVTDAPLAPNRTHLRWELGNLPSQTRALPLTSIALWGLDFRPWIHMTFGPATKLFTTPLSPCQIGNEAMQGENTQVVWQTLVQHRTE